MKRNSQKPDQNLTGISRKEFLKRSGIVIGGVAIGSTALLSACSEKTVTVTAPAMVPPTAQTTPTAPPAGGAPAGGVVGGMVDPASMNFLKLEQGAQGLQMGSLTQLSWEGSVVWSFKDWPQLKGSKEPAMIHHDFEREGNPVGYYAPGQDFVANGKTLMLSHQVVSNDPNVCEIPFDYDLIYEVDSDGKLTGFEWHSIDHIDELGLDDSARKFILNPKNYDPGGWEGKVFDFTHANTVSVLGKNKWYSDQKDERFNPNNIMMSFRNLGCLIIIDKSTGKIVWRVGPDWENPDFANLGGPIIGQHQTHIIPYGLPGAGNVLLFDNGSGSGYGGTKGYATHTRGYSRILEFNPVTLERVWEYTNKGFYSNVISGTQRLPNGNTLICEGTTSRIFEVTAKKEKVWEIKTGVLGVNNSGTCPGYTLLSTSMADTIMVDMDGKNIKNWNLMNFPAKMLSDGSVMGGVMPARASMPPGGAPGGAPPGGAPGGAAGTLRAACYRAHRVPPEWVPGNPSGYARWGDLYK